MSQQQANSKFQDVHPDGIYKVKVIGQALGESAAKKTPFLLLRVEVLALVKAKDGRSHTIKTGSRREINLYLTHKTSERVKAFLQGAGFPKGQSLTTLNPNDPRHFSMIGHEFSATNTPETYTNKEGVTKPIDKFEALISTKDPNAWMSRVSTPNTAKMLQLDAIFASAPDYSAAVAKPAPKPKPQREPGDESDDVPLDVPVAPVPAPDDFNW